MADQQQSDSEQYAELRVSIYLAEYQKLRDEMLESLRNQQQSIVLALGTVSVAIPLLLGQASNISGSLIAALLYILAMIYAVIALNVASSTHYLGEIGKYLHYHIKPEVNQLVKSIPGHEVIHLESFLMHERSSIVTKFLANVGPVSSIVLLLLPGAASLLTAQYVLSGTQVFQVANGPEISAALLTLLAIIAWGVYFVAILAFILSSIWWRWFRP